MKCEKTQSYKLKCLKGDGNIEMPHGKLDRPFKVEYSNISWIKIYPKIKKYYGNYNICKWTVMKRPYCRLCNITQPKYA